MSLKNPKGFNQIRLCRIIDMVLLIKMASGVTGKYIL